MRKIKKGDILEVRLKSNGFKYEGRVLDIEGEQFQLLDFISNKVMNLSISSLEKWDWEN